MNPEDLFSALARRQVGGVPVATASLRDIIRSKQSAGRERDLQHLPTLRKLLARLEGRRD
jgi:predicted nucleotidyltransferase